ncbi:RDD family protein [Nonlabens ponticola]|uniref:RDD family protein n=1 Tax=Nonlabens ponticola TaxID=2496866 RepID=A0A3S9N022_9FLAO|nr:RDD family protein [Nonlabens ponticola]AZQ44757.1 RDD family protein [Nonlabens ponticola]
MDCKQPLTPLEKWSRSMMNDPFLQEQEPFKSADEKELTFATFGNRLAATLLDTLFIVMPLGLLNVLNTLYWRDFYIYLAITICILSYKPVLETIYGATWGKMLIEIKVVDYAGERINALQAWLRSIFTVCLTLITIPFQYAIFNNEYLNSIDGFISYSTEMSIEYPALSTISTINFFILTIEIIFLVTDVPRRRAAHDRIAKTYVIKDPETL